LNNVEIFVEADLDFRGSYETTQNPLIPLLVDSIIDLLREQRKRTGNVEGGLARGQLHHRRILEAIILRDPIAARQSMQDHLLQVREDSDASPIKSD
jgi:DNA-binding FadR family transcriptional regulator